MGSRRQGDSPFRHEAPLRAEDLCDRADELAALNELCLGGRFVKLLAPRRFGKTSLLHAAFERLRRDHDATCVLCDLDGVVSRADLALRLQVSYAEQLRGRALRTARDHLAAAGISLTLGGGGVRAQLGAGVDPDQLVESLLDAPRRIAQRTGRPIVVALDEFQVVLALDGVDALLRSRIQHHAGQVGYIFCGSEPSMMEHLFDDRARPLYGQALPMRLGRLGRGDLAPYIATRFERTGRDPGSALDALLDVAEGHPQRAMLLAHALWLALAPGAAGDESSFADALAYVEREVEPECEALWRSLQPGERRTLRAIADGNTTVIPRSVQQALDLPRQTSDAARRRLLGEGLLERDGDRHRIVDPLFARWLRRLGLG
ncbi:MAG TPA: hypothetical protein VMU32_06775 [Solirubrobacteraceae bacterium]|nr:hypothetical protein [Solirubrobacteraceae bacterium]